MSEALKAPELFVFETTHRVYYNTQKPVPIKDVITALQGLEGVLKSLPQVVSGLTGIEIEGCEFLVQSIESGSLTEEIAIRFFFKDRAGLDAFVDKIGANKVMKGAVITAAIAGIVVYGLSLSMSGKPAPNITANNNVIINIGAGEVNMTPESFAAVVRAAVGDKKGTAESTLKLIAPARSDPGSTVTMNGVGMAGESGQKLEISAASISEAPVKLDLGANERIEEFPDVELYIRATNLDSKKVGWAGKLSNRADRLPIELDPSVSENDIFGRASVRVDAAVIYTEKGKSRSLKASRIYVRRVIK